MAVAASTSMATPAVYIHRLVGTRPAAIICPLPQRLSLSSTPVKLLKDSRSSSQVLAKTSSSDESSLDANELFTDLKEKWDAVEDKPTVILYGGGAIVAVWLASIVVGAINSVPLLPKIMELVGLGYTGWFVYRYLLFKASEIRKSYSVVAVK